MKHYIPEKGDIVTIDINPQAGHEQKGRRPGLVVSNTLFNRHSGLCFVCPITNTDRGYPFHVSLPDGNKVTGIVMADQMKLVDYRARKVKFISRASANTLQETMALVEAIIF